MKKKNWCVGVDYLSGDIEGRIHSVGIKTQLLFGINMDYRNKKRNNSDIGYVWIKEININVFIKYGWTKHGYINIMEIIGCPSHKVPKILYSKINNGILLPSNGYTVDIPGMIKYDKNFNLIMNDKQKQNTLISLMDSKQYIDGLMNLNGIWVQTILHKLKYNNNTVYLETYIKDKYQFINKYSVLTQKIVLKYGLTITISPTHNYSNFFGMETIFDFDVLPKTLAEHVSRLKKNRKHAQ